MSTQHSSPKITLMLILATVLIICGSCTEKNLYQGPEISEKPSINDLFDYSTEQSCQVSIDYGFKDYIVLFELYEDNPLTEEDGSVIKKDIEPLYRASTDENGKFTDIVTLPGYLSEVWLYSDFIGTISPVKLAISNNTISFNQKSYLLSAEAKTRALTATTKNYSYPDEFKIIGEWTDVWGTPAYLQDRELPPSEILYNIKSFYRRAGDYIISQNHKELFDNSIPSDLNIKKTTKIYLTFLQNSAAMKNMVGYYTYPTGTTPTQESIQKIIAFPHTSNFYDNNGARKGPLVSGDKIQLKYWDGESFKEEFPENVSIGWIILSNCFNEGNIKATSSSKEGYSTPSLNKDGKRRTVSLRTEGDDKLVAIGFEDNTDMNYCDAIFYVKYDTPEAIDPDLPPLPDVKPPSSDDNYTTFKGTLAFEDLWPSQGDYDMNDLVIYYESKSYKTIVNNKVVRTEDTYTMADNSNGAQYQNGFGYQLSNISNDEISNISIEGPVTSSYMQGNMTEPGQSHPTIILFDNQKDVISKTFKVITEFKNELEQSLVKAPYNPFVIIKANEGRGRELHLATLPPIEGKKPNETDKYTKNYKPTDKADTSFFGTENDLTGELTGVYYVSNNYMPFAIHISNDKFNFPDESQKITDAYPKFASWASSKGDKDKDWYKSNNKKK